MSRRKEAPIVVFGAGGKVTKALLGGIDDAGRAHMHICQLRDGTGLSFGDDPIAVEDDNDLSCISGEYVHFMFCCKESLEAFVRAAERILKLMEEEK